MHVMHIWLVGNRRVIQGAIYERSPRLDKSGGTRRIPVLNIPRIEGLEDRKLLYATLGGSFAFGSRITYSFAPDGTNIGGIPSALFSTMAAGGSPSPTGKGPSRRPPPPGRPSPTSTSSRSPTTARPSARRATSRGTPGSATSASAGRPSARAPWPPASCPRPSTAARWPATSSSTPPSLAGQRRLRPGDGRHPRVRPRPGPGPLGDLHRRHVRLLHGHEAGADLRRHRRHPGGLRRPSARRLRRGHGQRQLRQRQQHHAAAQRQRPGGHPRRWTSSTTSIPTTSSSPRRPTPAARSR